MVLLDPTAVLRGHLTSVNTIDWLSSLNLISGALDGEVRVWNTERKRVSGSALCHGDSVLTVVSSTLNETDFISSGKDGFVKVWDSSSFGSGPAKCALRTYADHFCGIAVGCDGLIASPCQDTRKVLSWDSRTSDISVHFTVPERCGMVTSLAVAHAAQVLVGCEDGSLLWMDLRLPKSPLLQMQAHSQPIFAIDVNLDRNVITTAGADDSINRFDLTFANEVKEPSMLQRDIVTLEAAGVGALSTRLDNRIVIAGLWDGNVRMFDCKRMKPIATLRHHRDCVFGAKFSRFSESATVFATASKDSTIALWNVLGNTYKAPQRVDVDDNSSTA